MPATPRLLLIEDSAGDARMTKTTLARMPPPIPVVTHVASLESALSTLAQQTFDIIVTDLDLPDSERLDTCRRVCEASRGMPVVVLTGSHDESIGLEALQLGAQDFLSKREVRVPELCRVLVHAKERQRMLVSLQEAKRATEEALARTRELEQMREQMIHMIIHDLRSPVFGMRLYLESFLRDAGTSVPDLLKEDIAKAYDLTGNLVEMVSSILDVHRIESGQMPLSKTVVNLRLLIQEAVDQIAGHASRSALRVEVPDLDVVCDAALIRRTVANLVANALRFSPSGKAVVIAAAALGGSREITVRDEGRGIPAEAHARIFEKFGSLDANGKSYSTGLGLPFCKIVVNLHGGDIGVRSEPGSGSTFWFTLPSGGSANAGGISP
jgi:two-component system, sensor histidine kinase and response regulator